MRRLRLCAVLIVCLGVTTAAQVQQAAIDGTVVDSSGLPVLGASLTLPASAVLDLRLLKFFPVKPHGKSTSSSKRSTSSTAPTSRN